jgi:hypothetical protein
VSTQVSNPLRPSYNLPLFSAASVTRALHLRRN